MKGIVLKISKIIIDIITVVILLLLSCVIICKVLMFVNKDNYLNIFGFSFFKVITGSMEPEINIDDVIIVKKSDTYTKGDIITYYKDGNFITHRIVSINSNNIITRGDANNTNDEPIAYDIIIGKVIKTYHGLGIWQKILTTPSVYISIFITILLFDFAFSYKGKKEQLVTDKKESNNELPKEKEIIKKKEVLDYIEKDETLNKDYTIRLDLNKLQEEINKKISKEEENDK